MIYLASPYTASKPDGSADLQKIEDRFDLAVQAIAQLTRGGISAYSPIVHYHTVAERHNLPPSFDFWAHFNLDALKRCDSFYILDIPGWRESSGLKRELEWAREYNLPRYIYDFHYKQVTPYETRAIS